MPEIEQSVGELSDRLRNAANVIPSDLWTWLNPLLTEAAEKIDHLERQLDNAVSANLDE